MEPTRNKDEVRDYVRERYGAVAKAAGGCCGPRETVGAKEGFAEGLGYKKEDLEALPEGANLGLSCGNPVALATLREGETVLDLGAGGGFDCFIAGRKVGASGRVIGVDMTPEMVSRARAGLAKYREATGLDNVEFRLGEIEHLPLADASVDVVISNCVLNLSPEKPQVWREIARVMKPGARVAVSDIALLKPIPAELARDLHSISACLAGAVPVPQYVGQIQAAGLEHIEVEPVPGGGDVWESYQDPIVDKIRALLPAGARLGDYAASVRATARKPAEGAACTPGPAMAAMMAKCCG